MRVLTCIDLTGSLVHELIRSWVISWHTFLFNILLPETCSKWWISSSRMLLTKVIKPSTCNLSPVTTSATAYCWTDLPKELIEVSDVSGGHCWAVAEAPFAFPTTLLPAWALFLGRGWLRAANCTFVCYCPHQSSPLDYLNKHTLLDGYLLLQQAWVKWPEQHVTGSDRHLEVTKYRLNPITITSLTKHLSDRHKNAQSTHACCNQCWLVTKNHNDQNFLERLSWRALLLNLVAGDLPGDAPLPPRGDMLGEKKKGVD